MRLNKTLLGILMTVLVAAAAMAQAPVKWRIKDGKADEHWDPATIAAPAGR